ncbi:MAG TPA: aldehyde dehydrogenase family protein [Candidatus Micrarchaeia archaeon]|nr:aldehyde dehydrogenase family protein [Candidatus Micrarchaeia archaeon]
MVMTARELDPRVQAFLSGGPKRLLIDGALVEAISGKTFATHDPATGEHLADVAEGEAADIDRAVQAARRAFDGGPWSKLTASERARLIWRLADLIEDRTEVFAQLETLDNGKPLTVARRDDVGGTVEYFRYYAGWPTRIEGATVPVSVADTFAYTLRQPVGVCGQIVPWNYPLMMAAWKVAPALAAGCTVVLKPAEQTPLSALLLGELCLEAGIPAGVVNVVTGYGETAGAALAAHPAVDKIAFTGSSEVGRLILRAASQSNLKKVSLELGGKSPNIVFADADLAAAREGAAAGIFYNMGQDCTAGSRVFVEGSIYDDVAQFIADQAAGLRVGPGFDEATEIGPLVSQEQLDRVLGYIQLGPTEGARVLSGGGRAEGAGLDRGFFVRPTVLADARNEMRVAQEEIFGPVVSVIPFRDVDDVIRQGNDIAYGLGAGIWTKNLAKAHRVAAAIKAGTVWVNTYGATDPALPFGGFKESGHGREMGFEAIHLYTEVKSVWINLGEA